MSQFDPSIHHRRSIRLKGYDYSQEGLYFVTVCVQNRECLFGNVVNGEMVLNEYGKMVQMAWEELPQHYKNVELDEFVIMPNHIHGIIIITDSVGAGLKPAQMTIDTNDANNVGSVVRAGLKPAPTHGLSEIIRALKAFSARKINEIRNTRGEKLWQRNYWEHIIRNQQSYQRIADYILTNPVKWENDILYNQ
jgi:REP element-mobilizing transposase RayT